MKENLLRVDFVAEVGGAAAAALNGSARPPLASRHPTKLPKISSGNKPPEASSNKRDEEQPQQVQHQQQ